MVAKRFCADREAKIDFLKWYLSVNSSEIYGKFRVFGPKKIKKIDFSLYSTSIFFLNHDAICGSSLNIKIDKNTGSVHQTNKF
jgi:hypothetical protein